MTFQEAFGIVILFLIFGSIAHVFLVKSLSD